MTGGRSGAQCGAAQTAGMGKPMTDGPKGERQAFWRRACAGQAARTAGERKEATKGLRERTVRMRGLEKLQGAESSKEVQLRAVEV